MYFSNNAGWDHPFPRTGCAPTTLQKLLEAYRPRQESGSQNEMVLPISDGQGASERSSAAGD